MEAYSSESSPPNPIPKLPMTPAPPVVGHHRAATGLGGLPQLCVGGKANLTLQASHAAGDMAELKDSTAKPVWDVLMMQGSTGGSSSNPVTADQNANNESFILDSGASVHATGNRAVLSDIKAVLQPEDTVLCMANGSTLTAQESGTVRHDNITLVGVLYAPGLDINAVSVSKLGEQGYTVEFTRTTCFIRDAITGDLVGKGHLVAGLYELDFLEGPRA